MRRCVQRSLRELPQGIDPVMDSMDGLVASEEIRFGRSYDPIWVLARSPKA